MNKQTTAAVATAETVGTLRSAIDIEADAFFVIGTEQDALDAFLATNPDTLIVDVSR